MLKFFAHYPLGDQAQTIVVEGQRSLQIIDAEGDQGDAGFHGLFSCDVL
ncbi:hypothetical protein LP416_15110 [Polaromonas sp. P2-4]|nr:hypothetical protein LP416_15110 [Polaromonas sp. P2-4]